MENIRLPALVILFILWAASAWSGVIVTEENGAKSFFEKGKMKSVDAAGNPDMIMDYDRGDLTVIDNEEATYIRTSVKEWCSEIQSAQQAMLEQIPPEVRQQMEGIVQDQQGDYTVEEGKKEEVAGYEATRFVVLKDGQPEEIFWVSSDKRIMAEVGDWRQFVEAMQEFSSCMMSPFGEGESDLLESYSEVYEKGFPVKNVKVKEGQEGESTLSIEFSPFPAEIFSPPAEYREVTIEEAFGGE